MSTEPTATEALAALKLGRIPDEPNDVYHAAPAVSVSKLKVFRHSPALYYGRFISGTIPAPEATPALLFGSAAGALILEGREVYNRQYCVIPEDAPARPTEAMLNAAKPSPASLARQDYWRQWDAANAGKHALGPKQSAALERMNANVLAHRHAGQLLAACKPEITWRIKGDSFHMQVRTDCWSDEGCALTDGAPFIADLKTIQELPDDEPETISRQIAAFWYHGQAYAYREIVSSVMGYKDGWRPRFFFIFVEKEEPYGVQVVELDDVAMDLAYRQVKDTIERLKWCHANGKWPLLWADTFQDKVPSVGLPNYYVRREIGDDVRSIW